jgi:teichuronic acid biosynthesis glycosyltransferase TuaC
MKNYNKPNILIVGPYPPPSGGVATFIKSVLTQKDLNELYNLTLYRTGRKSINTPLILQSVIEMYLVLKFFFTLKFKNINVFHIHTASEKSYIRNIPYILISKHLSHGKVVVHIHGGKFETFFEQANKIVKKLIKYSLESSDCIIVTSSSWIHKIKKIFNKSNNVYSITNGFDPNIFYPIPKEKAREFTNTPKDKKIIINIGTLETWKGHRYILESMRKIIEERKDVLMYFIGEGSQKEKIAGDIRANNLEEHVFLAGGNKSPKEIALWINSCDLFVMPSLIEGNPTVMFECLACGKPFIGTTVGGIPDIIISKEYGLLSKPGDTKDLTEKILIALNKEWKFEEITKYAENFTWNNISAKIIKLYEKIEYKEKRNHS